MPDHSDKNGDLLAQPTRARLYALLGEQSAPVTTEQLAEGLDRHVNGVRLHLERLAAAGLVRRERERGGRGRPRDLWSLAAEARPQSLRPTAYAELARWLVQSLEHGGVSVESVEEIGREIGRGLGDGPSAEDATAELLAMIGDLGFEPQDVERDSGNVHFCFGNCPFREAARDHQPLVCGLHRGITRGMLETVVPDGELVEFVPKNPETAGCEIEIRLPAAEQRA